MNTNNDLAARVRALRNMVRLGLMDYDKAEEEALPLLEELNLKIEQIAKKYNRKPIKVVFAKL
jgi:hypothetical protein